MLWMNCSVITLFVNLTKINLFSLEYEAKEIIAMSLLEIPIIWPFETKYSRMEKGKLVEDNL